MLVRSVLQNKTGEKSRSWYSLQTQPKTQQSTKALMGSMTRTPTATPAFKTLQMQSKRHQSTKALMGSMTRTRTPVSLTPAFQTLS
jgi:hypothetical protein